MDEVESNRTFIMADQQEAPVENTNLSDDELDHFKELLLKEKQEAEEKIEEFEQSIEDLQGTMDDTTSSAAHHQGNIASEEEQREKYYTLIEKQKDKIGEIKVALDRMEAGNYGVCLVTGKPIQKERLEIKPYARLSVEALESEMEQTEKERMNVENTPA